MMHLNVLSASNRYLFEIEEDQFVRSAAARWPDRTHVLRHPDRPYVVTVQIDDADDPGFQVLLSGNGGQVRCEGSGVNMGEAVLWVRSLIPDDPGGEVWMVDEGFNGHAVLRPGMTLDELEQAWVDHEESPPDMSVFEG